MGYTTEFRGKLTISPALPADVVKTVKEFCKIRHEGSKEVGIGIWCDWEVSADGTSIYWNGSEKSYDMDTWIKYLHRNFFPTHSLTGTIEAQGEAFDDRWGIRGNGTNPVLILKAKMTYTT